MVKNLRKGKHEYTRNLQEDIKYSSRRVAQVNKAKLEGEKTLTALEKDKLLRHNREHRSTFKRGLKASRFQSAIKWTEDYNQKFPGAKPSLVSHYGQCGMVYIVDETFIMSYKDMGPMDYLYDPGAIATDLDDQEIIYDSEGLYPLVFVVWLPPLLRNDPQECLP